MFTFLVILYKEVFSSTWIFINKMLYWEIEREREVLYYFRYRERERGVILFSVHLLIHYEFFIYIFKNRTQQHIPEQDNVKYHANSIWFMTVESTRPIIYIHYRFHTICFMRLFNMQTHCLLKFEKRYMFSRVLF